MASFLLSASDPDGCASASLTSTRSLGAGKTKPVADEDALREQFRVSLDDARAADLDPPTVSELEALRDGCEALGSYAEQMRDLLDFAGLTLMRPGELFELRYSDVDLRTNRILVSRRLLRGRVDTPEVEPLQDDRATAPARDILLRQPTRARDDGLVFVGKTGTRLNAALLSLYWSNVRARARLDESFDFYPCSKHWGMHPALPAGPVAAAIAAQAGWRESAVESLLGVYGHRELVALAEMDALYASESDAAVTQEAPDGL